MVASSTSAMVTLGLSSEMTSRGRPASTACCSRAARCSPSVDSRFTPVLLRGRGRYVFSTAASRAQHVHTHDAKPFQAACGRQDEDAQIKKLGRIAHTCSLRACKGELSGCASEHCHFIEFKVRVTAEVTANTLQIFRRAHSIACGKD